MNLMRSNELSCLAAEIQNRCSSLGFGIKEPTTEILVEMLSELIVEVFFYESNQNRE